MANKESGRNSLLKFLVSLIAGAFGIYVGALVVLGTSNITTALLVALVGAIVWGVASFFLGWIPPSSGSYISFSLVKISFSSIVETAKVWAVDSIPKTFIISLTFQNS